MKFRSKTDETIFVSEVLPERSYMFDQDIKTGLSIIWNTGNHARFVIDNKEIVIEKGCVIFLTEYHKIEDFQFEKMNVVQFNRPFYCVEEQDTEVGCKGLLFFGASNIPKIEIPIEKQKQFNLIWEVFLMEMEEMDSLKLDMLRTLLKRFLILCLRVYKNSNNNLPSDNVNVGLIREYNYLVEKHYKTLTRVSDYASLLHKSPKTLANIFKAYTDKTPLQIINQRRLLEANRLLKYTDKPIQEIADEIKFSDIQSFSHFYKQRQGIAPSAFRKASQTL